jgi:5-methylcytosine-specific restriction endonuclease McrA
MPGRIRRKLLAAQQGQTILPALPICPVCGRPIPKSQQDAHHFVPKSKGGKATELLHRICHRQIHALFTETELARRYNNVDVLLAHPEVARFVDWVKAKPDDFYERTHKSQRVRER